MAQLEDIVEKEHRRSAGLSRWRTTGKAMEI
jgi:hypothetical protein